MLDMRIYTTDKLGKDARNCATCQYFSLFHCPHAVLQIRRLFFRIRSAPVTTAATGKYVDVNQNNNSAAPIALAQGAKGNRRVVGVHAHTRNTPMHARVPS